MKCKRCGLSPLAEWELPLHTDCEKKLTNLRAIGWGILFALPFIVMVVAIMVVYK